MFDDDKIFGDNNNEAKAEKICIRIIVEGKVQKVGYRNWLKGICVRSNITGTVRNKNDGTVEAVLYGDEKIVKNVILQCYKGPTFSEVEKITEFTEENSINISNDFLIISA